MKKYLCRMLAKFAYYCLIQPLSYLPLRILYLLTDFFFILIITLIPYRKKVIQANLKRSFPDKSPQEINRLTFQFYHHFTDLLAEGVKNLTISQKELNQRFKVKNPELMNQLYAANKSVLLVSGHYNNWEWLITTQNHLFPHQAMGIGMPLTSKFWDKKLNERRSRYGMKVVHAKNFKEAIQQDNNQPIAILVLSDQSPADAKKSYWMNFLNQPTAVLFGAEQMAHTYDFAVVFFETKKIKRGYYEMELTLITDAPKNCKWGEITEQHTKQLEKIIQAHPQYWIWSHKRWKREIPQNLEELKVEQQAKFEERFNR